MNRAWAGRFDHLANFLTYEKAKTDFWIGWARNGAKLVGGNRYDLVPPFFQLGLQLCQRPDDTIDLRRPSVRDDDATHSFSCSFGEVIF